MVRLLMRSPEKPPGMGFSSDGGLACLFVGSKTLFGCKGTKLFSKKEI